MIAILAALALMSAPQDAKTANTDTVKTMKGMHEFSACVAKDREKSGKLLGVVPGTPEESKILVELMSEGCPRFGDVTIEPILLRGTIAEAMFEQDFGRIGAPPKNPTPPLFATPTATELNALPTLARFNVALLIFADCVVKASPNEAMAILRTDSGTPSERAAFAKLAPALGPCLTAGAKVEFNRNQLRGAMAEASYRGAVAARTGTAR